MKSGQDVVFLVRQRGSTRQDGTIFWPVHFRNRKLAQRELALPSIR